MKDLNRQENQLTVDLSVKEVTNTLKKDNSLKGSLHLALMVTMDLEKSSTDDYLLVMNLCYSIELFNFIR